LPMNIQDFISGFQSLPMQKKLIAGLLLVSVAGGIIVFSLFASKPVYDVLFTNLDMEDAAKVIAKLEEERIPYKTQANGGIIEVPRDKVYKLRLTMASEGVTRGGGIGFEVFDDQSWSTSRFVQEVNYRRALEGELARTINSVREVERARVHLVLPPDSPFVDVEQTRTKASVVLQIKGGARLNPGQVQGIAYLVSSSVKGLKPEDVSVIDTDGNLLTGTNGQGDNLVAISSHQLEYKKLMEGDLEQRVTRMLENVVGNGRAVVRVSANRKRRKKYLPQAAGRWPVPARISLGQGECRLPRELPLRRRSRSIITRSARWSGGWLNPRAL